MPDGLDLPLGSEFIASRLESLRPQETIARALSHLETTKNDVKVLLEVDQALQDKQFTVYLQPQCNSETRTVIGMEALVRWIHPERGIISPGYFIPVLERANLIANLDTVIWEEVCETLGRWAEQGKNIVPISINVSIGDIQSLDVSVYLCALCEKYHVDHKMLRVEITESLMAQNIEDLIELTSNLREMGFKVLMDDFGSGYSSLNMLKDTNIDVLKLDMKFIDLNTNNFNKGSKIVESVVEMAHQLGLPVIAEGVENQEQLRMLHSFDCIYVQGFKFHKPMPIENAEVLLSQPDTQHYWDLALDSKNRNVKEVHHNFVQNVAAHACEILGDYLVLFARANLITDEFELINRDPVFPEPRGGIVGSMHEYIQDCLDSNFIAPEFLQEFKERTNIERLRSFMFSGSRTRTFTFRTTLEGEYEWITLGFTARKDCSPQNPWCVFFVRKETYESLPARVLGESYEFDTLTGTYNFEKFKNDLEVIPVEYQGPLSCIYFDVIGLHDVNNHIGHAAGDQMLESIGRELKKAFSGGRIYRLGGDEFLVILFSDSEEAVREAIALTKYNLKHHEIEISSGYAIAPDSHAMRQLVERAEKYMFSNKKSQYASGSKGRQLRMLNQHLEEAIQLQDDLEHSFEMILPNCTGVYVVNMLDDTMRYARAPEGFKRYAVEPGATFSDTARKYTEDSILPKYQSIVTDLLDYDVVRSYLWSGKIIERYYERNDGICFELKIYPYSKENAYKDYSLWVFTIVDKHE